MFEAGIGWGWCLSRYLRRSWRVAVSQCSYLHVTAGRCTWTSTICTATAWCVVSVLGRIQVDGTLPYGGNLRLTRWRAPGYQLFEVNLEYPQEFTTFMCTCWYDVLRETYGSQWQRETDVYFAQLAVVHYLLKKMVRAWTKENLLRHWVQAEHVDGTHINRNTKERMMATNAFKKYFYKLMNVDAKLLVVAMQKHISLHAFGIIIPPIALHYICTKQRVHAIVQNFAVQNKSGASLWSSEKLRYRFDARVYGPPAAGDNMFIASSAYFSIRLEYAGRDNWDCGRCLGTYEYGGVSAFM